MVDSKFNKTIKQKRYTKVNKYMKYLFKHANKLYPIGHHHGYHLTFKNRASYIQDGRTATLQMLHFIFFFNKYKY